MTRRLPIQYPGVKKVSGKREKRQDVSKFASEIRKKIVNNEDLTPWFWGEIVIKSKGGK